MHAENTLFINSRYDFVLPFQYKTLTHMDAITRKCKQCDKSRETHKEPLVYSKLSH